MSGYKFYTYFHTRNDIDEVFYVGKGSGRRAFATNHNPHWQHIVAKHGRTVHIVAYFENEADAFTHEKELIAELREAGFNLANMTDGGDGVCPTAEVREKMRAASAVRWSDPSVRLAHGEKAKGRKHSDAAKEKLRIKSTGKLHSQESKDKMSAVQAGRIVSEQCREKLRAANLGKKQSEATKAKRRATSKGRIFTESHRIKLSLAARGNKRRLGMTTSAETKAKQSAAAKARSVKSDPQTEAPI